MPLLDYASDDDSDAEAGTLSAVEGPGIRKESDSHTAVVPIVDGFHLPAPKSNRRRDGPVKIKVDLPKLNDTDDGPPRGPQKKSKTSGGPIPKGAGTSSLLSMLPAPKKEGVSLPKRARVLGGGLKGSDIPGTTIFVETNHELPVAHPSSTTVESSSTAPSGLFVPPSMARSRLQESKPSLPDSFLGPVSALPPKPDPPQSMNFFSLGEPQPYANTNHTILICAWRNGIDKIGCSTEANGVYSSVCLWLRRCFVRSRRQRIYSPEAYANGSISGILSKALG